MAGRPPSEAHADAATFALECDRQKRCDPCPSRPNEPAVNGHQSGELRPALQIFRNQLEISQRSLSLLAVRLEGPFETVADVVMDHRLLGAFDRALDRLQLLGNLSTRSIVFDHFDDALEMTIGAFQSPGNCKMRMVTHCFFRSYRCKGITFILPRG